jgi:hypothetical protein
MTTPPHNSADSNGEPWYEDGLRFQCTGCGDCCTGAPGFVWVNKREIAAMAEQLDVDVETFEARYVRVIGIRKSLVERRNGDCILFDKKTRKCTVYESRPRQCRMWPFWRSNLRTSEDWAQTCRDCPGSGTGRLYSLDEIEAQASTMMI